MTNLAVSVLGSPPAFPDSTGGAVPGPSRRGTRFPFLFLVDTSGSTGVAFQAGGSGSDADIHRINTAIQGMFRNLRYPTAGSDLANEQDNIDVSLITYNSTYSVPVPWTMATNLDPNLTPFVADGATATGAALQYTLGYLGHRLRYYRDNNIKHGRPYILHFTDGAPTDMVPGDSTWLAVQARLHRVSPLNDPERQFAVIRHLITANGVDANRSKVALGGTSTGTGLDVLAKLSGPKSTLALADHPNVVAEITHFASMIVTGVTQIYGNHEPDPNEITDDALQDLAHIKRAS